jgi:hypothetical protein
MKKYDIEWLNRQIQKDNKEIDNTKKKLIDDLKNFNKEEFFKKEKKELTLFEKITKLFK